MRLTPLLTALLLVAPAFGAPISTSLESRGFGNVLKTEIANTARIAVSRISPELKQAITQAIGYLDTHPDPLLSISVEDADVLLQAAERGDGKVISALETAITVYWSKATVGDLNGLSDGGSKLVASYKVVWDESANGLNGIVPTYQGNVFHSVASKGKQAAKDFASAAKSLFTGPAALSEASDGAVLRAALDLKPIGGSGDRFNWPAELSDEQMDNIKSFIQKNPDKYQKLRADITAKIGTVGVQRFEQLDELKPYFQPLSFKNPELLKEYKAPVKQQSK